MMRFRYARAAVRPAFLALLALSGCTTHTTKQVRGAPVTPVVQVQSPTLPANEIPTAVRPVKARKPKLVATTQIEPCVFRGSLFTTGKLYSQAAGAQAIAQLDGSAAVQIDRLELPSTPGERVKVVVASPIQMEAYIDEKKEAIVQIDQRVDIVPGHVWLERGTDVHASLLPNGTAEITKQFRIRTTPSQHVKPLPCAKLSLTQGYVETPIPEGDGVNLGPDRISIRESAGGREVAAIHGVDDSSWVSVRLVEKKPGWLHVEGYEEFHFKGWIAESSVSSPVGYGMIGLLAQPDDVTHQVTVPIPLRIEATDAAPVIAKAAKGAEILIAPGPPGYRVIRFGVGVEPLKDAPFLAREADLRGAAAAATGGGSVRSMPR